MRLLNVHSLRLESFQDGLQAPPYAILSHRWGEGEVLFEDLLDQPHTDQLFELKNRVHALEQEVSKLKTELQDYGDPTMEQAPIEIQLNGETLTSDRYPDRSHASGPIPTDQVSATKKPAWAKVTGCCEQAQRFGVDYVWIDTCCINKSSSSELSEAINSMFNWYRDAKICIAYLSDFTKRSHTAASDLLLKFTASKWFDRGWTLQELIAPKEVWFFNDRWQFFGLRSSLASHIARATGINEAVLVRDGLKKLTAFSVATRLSWAAWRITTRPEDRAYSLLGLFGVSLATLYGEGGEAAFFRLQEQIFQTFPDHSILAWKPRWTAGDHNDELDLFARTPDFFRSAKSPVAMSLGTLLEAKSYDELGLEPSVSFHVDPAELQSQYSMFSHGIRIQLLIRSAYKDQLGREVFEACLACRSGKDDRFVVIRLVRTRQGQFKRLAHNFELLEKSRIDERPWSIDNVYVFNPQRDLSAWQTRFTIGARQITVLLQIDPVAKGEVELGYSTWPIEPGHDSSTQSFKMRSFPRRFFEMRPNMSSRETLAGLRGGLDLAEEVPGQEDRGALVFRLQSAQEDFAVILSLTTNGLKGAIVPEVESSAFERGCNAVGSNNHDWQDLSLLAVQGTLASGKLVFISTNSHQLAGTVTLIVGIEYPVVWEQVKR